ncbi:kinesin-like protein KIFC1 [Neosynchiropus ocellatus]
MIVKNEASSLLPVRKRLHTGSSSDLSCKSSRSITPPHKKPRNYAVSVVAPNNATKRPAAVAEKDRFAAPNKVGRAATVKSVPTGVTRKPLSQSTVVSRGGNVKISVAPPGKRTCVAPKKPKVTEKQDKLQEIQKQLQSSNQENEELKDSLTQSRSKIIEQEELIKGLKSRVSDQETALSGVRGELGQVSVAKKVVEAELASLAVDHKTLELLRDQQAAELEALRSTLKATQEDVRSLEDSLATAKDEIHAGEMERRVLHNTIQELKGNIRVFCRIRPPLGGRALGDHIQLKMDDNKSLSLFKREESQTGKSTDTLTNYDFSFDRVFGPEATQQEIFEEISLLVQSALDGYNVCCFAYGQTGSGKTYTMEGSEFESRGMIPRAVQQVFTSAQKLESQGWKFTFTASFVEIYNETLRDLLCPGKNAKDVQHEFRKVKNDIKVTNLTYKVVTHEEQVFELIALAKQKRSTAETARNEHSSRSHSVFQLDIEGVNAGRKLKCNSTLSLVDLAGSERMLKSQIQGERFKEMTSINGSLTSLSMVIGALANKESYVPYRNSKLTYLLQTCLGGNSKTLMFVNIAPEADCFGETLSSLRFASKVNSSVIGSANANVK